MEKLREEISKRETALAAKKEKLFINAKDASLWELAQPLSPEEFLPLSKDKTSAF